MYIETKFFSERVNGVIFGATAFSIVKRMTHRPRAPWLSFTMAWRFFLVGYLAFLAGDGDGERDETLSGFEADSWASLAAEDDDDLDSFVSFDLPFLTSSHILSSSAASFYSFCVSTFFVENYWLFPFLNRHGDLMYGLVSGKWRRGAVILRAHDFAESCFQIPSDVEWLIK